MNPVKVPLLLVSILAIIAPSLMAQELRPVECRFVVLDEKPEGVMNAVGEGKDVAIELVKNRISEPFDCFAIDGRLSFIEGTDRKPLASIALPAKITKAILIFVKEPNKDSWVIIPFENSPEQYPPGGTHVVNLHSGNIRFILGETKEELTPLKSKGFEMPKERTEFNMAPVIFQFKNKKGDWATGKETSYRFLPGTRYLLIAYIDPDNGRPRVKTYKDTFRPRPPAQ